MCGNSSPLFCSLRYSHAETYTLARALYMYIQMFCRLMALSHTVLVLLLLHLPLSLPVFSHPLRYLLLFFCFHEISLLCFFPPYCFAPLIHNHFTPYGPISFSLVPYPPGHHVLHSFLASFFGTLSFRVSISLVPYSPRPLFTPLYPFVSPSSSPCSLYAPVSPFCHLF